MNKRDKALEMESLKEALKDAPPTFVMAYRGLTVNQVAALRKKVRATASRYRVIKNRLALRVLQDTPLKSLAPHLKGPTAIAYCSKDPAKLAKVLEEFGKEIQGLQVKAGFVDGRLVDPQAVKELAALPPREVLVARLMAALNGPMVRLLTALKGPARGLVRVMDEIGRKKGEGAGASPPPGGPAT